MNITLLQHTEGGRRFLARREQAVTGSRRYLSKIVTEANKRHIKKVQRKQALKKQSHRDEKF